MVVVPVFVGVCPPPRFWACGKLRGFLWVTILYSLAVVFLVTASRSISKDSNTMCSMGPYLPPETRRKLSWQLLEVQASLPVFSWCWRWGTHQFPSELGCWGFKIHSGDLQFSWGAHTLPGNRCEKADVPDQWHMVAQFYQNYIFRINYHGSIL